ncbi:MAG: hypothetical protein WBL67_03245, partial [Nitrososphaeraceae archaeon]
FYVLTTHMTLKSLDKQTPDLDYIQSFLSQCMEIYFGNAIMMIALLLWKCDYDDSTSTLEMRL